MIEYDIKDLWKAAFRVEHLALLKLAVDTEDWSYYDRQYPALRAKLNRYGAYGIETDYCELLDKFHAKVMASRAAEGGVE